jgi:hypothetical protein
MCKYVLGRAGQVVVLEVAKFKIDELSVRRSCKRQISNQDEVESRRIRKES